MPDIVTHSRSTGKKPLSEHLADFRKHLGDKGNADQHVPQTADRAKFSGIGSRQAAELPASLLVVLPVLFVFDIRD